MNIILSNRQFYIFFVRTFFYEKIIWKISNSRYHLYPYLNFNLIRESIYLRLCLSDSVKNLICYGNVPHDLFG